MGCRSTHNARGTAFENPDTSQVSIGTIVGLRDSDTGKEETYTVLGAWDGDPEKHVISYKTALGAALLGKRPGETVKVKLGGNEEDFTVVKISRYADPAAS